MKSWPLIIIGAALLAGCARFKSQPLVPEQSAARLEARRLDDPGLKKFLEQNLGHELPDWPLKSWDLPALTLAAFYFNPTLEVARAQWRVTQAGEKTAGGRPNPTLTLTPGYNSTTLIPTPWSPAVNFDLPLETMGKRAKRIAEARELSNSARYSVITTAWQVRSRVRGNLVDLKLAARRADLLQAQFAAQQQIIKLLQQRFDAGEISRPELTTAQMALNRSQLDLADAQARRVEARSLLAGALGLSLAALDGVQLEFDLSGPGATDLTTTAARYLALLGRADILGALADYAAAEAAVRLEVAKQYPDVHLNPGYQYDQADNKWTLGISFELPILNQNQGPIAEAEARRKLSAAKFIELQSQVIGEIDRAVAGWHVAQDQLKIGQALLAAQSRQQKSMQAQLAAGAADRLDLLSSQLELGSTSLLQLEGEAQAQRALGALEDALQNPLTMSDAVIQETQRNPRENKPISKHEP